MAVSATTSSDEKPQAQIDIVSTSENDSSDNPAQDQKGGTRQDVNDMTRMGKRQQLRRNFRFLSIVGFVMVLQSTWESVLLAAQYGLVNGGTAGVIWVTVAVIVGALCMIASIAEMASMAPTAGGQYHWVSEFAPRGAQKGLSYLVGWSSALGWVTGCPSAAQLTSTLVQGLVLLRYPEVRVDALWQTTLFIMLFLVAAAGFNVFCARQLPVTEGVFMVVHVVGFGVFMIVLWVTSEHTPAKEVFTQFQDNGGWGNTGLSALVGITTPLWCFLGPDAGAHMSEELKDASRILPSAMIWGSFFNALLGLLMLITLCFCLGPDWQDNVLGLTNPTQTGIPIIQVLYNSTNSIPATTFMTTILILLSMVGTITCIASSSRQVWAFARDKGFPFSRYVAYVSPAL